MTTELTVLAWGCILAIVHIMAAAHGRTRQYGVTWNMGARDEPRSPPSPVVGRLERAQANYFETFPVMAAAILIVSLAGLTGPMTAWGAIAWLAARLVYLPVYALGIPVLRSLLFGVSLMGLLMVLWPALTGP